MSDYVLYIMMRTDMKSMNAGKAMAQAAHAANMAQNSGTAIPDDKIGKAWKAWAGSRGFGTTVVLDGGSEEDILDSLEQIGEDTSDVVLFYGTVVDPTYPLQDGFVTHQIPVITCGFFFVDRSAIELESEVFSVITKSKLHR